MATEQLDTPNLKVDTKRSSSALPSSKAKFFEPYAISPNKQEIYYDIEETSSKELEILDKLVRQIFYEVIEKHHPKVARQLKDYFRAAENYSSGDQATDASGSLGQLCQALEGIEPVQKILISSAFSHMLNLHNITEEVENTVREELEKGSSKVPRVVPTTNQTIDLLMDRNQIDIKKIRDAICSQCVELTFTAHPTQAIRSSILHKYNKTRNLLHRRLQIMREEKRKTHLQVQQQYGITRLADDKETLEDFNTPTMDFERAENEELLKAYVQAAWRTDEIRRNKPTPQSECRQGLQYMEDTIFDTVPRFFREIDNCMVSRKLERIPLDHSIFRFGSWMGGDRDGNPNVTHATTRQVTIITRDKACQLFLRVLDDLTDMMSMWRCTPQFKEYAGTLNIIQTAKQFSQKNQRSTPDLREPYRVVLFYIIQKLDHTRTVLQRLLATNENVKQILSQENCFYENAHLYEPLYKMYESLVEIGDQEIAQGPLLNLLRQVQVFGLSLLPLDIRQESTEHTRVMDQVTEYLGIKEEPYSKWSEDDKVDWLVKELNSKRPLIPLDFKFD